MKNKYLLLFTALLITSMIIASCGGSGSAPAATKVPEKPKATVAAPQNNQNAPAGKSDGFDPANVSGDKALAAVGNVYEGLVRVQDGNVVGALAESFAVSEDGLEYTFNLRPGVTFHDGSALNADLVTANFNRWFDPADTNRGSGTFAAWAKSFGGFKGETKEDGKPKSQYDGIEKVNDYTVLVHLNTPDTDFLTKIAAPEFVIMSAAGFTGGDGGSGPYKIASSDASTLKLEPFAGYWDAAAVPTAGMDVPLK